MTPTGFRAIQRSALRSKKLRHLSDHAERLYFRLVLATDAYGVTEADPDLVKAAAAPGVKSLDEGVVEDALEELERHELIELFEHGGERYLIVAEFDENQLAEFLRKRGRPTHPLPPGHPMAGAKAESKKPCKTAQSALTPAPEEEVEEERVVPSGTTPLSDAVPAPSTPPKRVAPQKPSRTLEDIETDIATCRDRLGPDLAGMVDDLVLLMASENVTGKLSPARAHRELWHPISDLLDMLKPHDLVAGVKAAITNGAPNATYVKKAAQNAAKRRAPHAATTPIPNKRTSEYVVPVGAGS